MAEDRRNFIKKFGVTLGSLIVSGSLPGCGPKQEAGLSGTEGRIKKQGDSLPMPRGPEWEQLRQCWLNLRSPGKVTLLSYDYYRVFDRAGDSKAARDALGKDHQAILDTLVAKGQLEEPVAGHIQAAFEEAACHVIRSRATCYMLIPIEYAPRQDLLQQANVLRKISSDLDPATVAKAQAAIAQDVALFETSRKDGCDYTALARDYEAGDLRVSPETLEAARLLTQLFLEPSN